MGHYHLRFKMPHVITEDILYERGCVIYQWKALVLQNVLHISVSLIYLISLARCHKSTPLALNSNKYLFDML